MRPLNLIALLLFTGGLVWVFTLSQDAVRTIQYTYYSAVSPFLKSGSKAEIAARAFMDEVEHSRNLTEKLKQAERERDRFKLIAARVHELEKENNELRSAVHFKKQTRYDITPARIIRRNPLTWSSTAIIDRGSDSDLLSDQPVVASNGGLVGRIYNPVEGSSTVLLITDEASKVSAQIKGTPEKGILSGILTSYGEKAYLRLEGLSKNAAVTPGMMVYTDGRGKLFPPNIPIGRVESFNTGPVSGEALIKPHVDFDKISTLFVINQGGNTPEEK